MMKLCMKILINYCSEFCSSLSLGPHGAYFGMLKLKSQATKVSTVASVMRDK